MATCLAIAQVSVSLSQIYLRFSHLQAQAPIEDMGQTDSRSLFRHRKRKSAISIDTQPWSWPQAKFQRHLVQAPPGLVGIRSGQTASVPVHSRVSPFLASFQRSIADGAEQQKRMDGCGGLLAKWFAEISLIEQAAAERYPEAATFSACKRVMG